LNRLSPSLAANLLQLLAKLPHQLLCRLAVAGELAAPLRQLTLSRSKGQLGRCEGMLGLNQRVLGRSRFALGVFRALAPLRLLRFGFLILC
jgi:hypothetical protein